MNNIGRMIWIDGELIPWSDAKVHMMTHTLHYGMGVFEGIRSYKHKKINKGTIFRLEDHVKRLFQSAHIMQMDISYSEKEIILAIIDTIKANKLQDAYIRPMCFYGSEGLTLHSNNLKTHISISVWDLGTYLSNESIRIKTSSFTRHHVNTTMCKAKTNANYVNSLLAIQEVTADGYDEALLLDHEGCVSEGSSANIFIVKDNILYTPDTTTALNGITRASIFELARDEGINKKKKRISRDEVYIADEAFFTGTAAEITPIYEVDRRLIGKEKVGPITKLLQKLYLEHVHGESFSHKDWLTII